MSYIFSSACKLDEDEVTVMKYTNETLKQQPSEDFTNIDEDEPFAWIKNFSTQYEKYEREEGERHERLNTEIDPRLWGDNSSGTKVVKVSWLSLSKQTLSSHQSSKYYTGDMSPGMKFQKTRHSKINSTLLNQFFKDKKRMSNSWEKAEISSNPFVVKNRSIKNKENNALNVQNSFNMTPNLSNRQKEFGEVSSRKILKAKTNVQDYK